MALDGGNPNPIRTRETNLGDLVADGFRFAANRTAAADGRAVADIAFSNGGGIRTSIAARGQHQREAHVRRAAVRQRDGHGARTSSVAKLKALMEYGVASLPAVDGRFPQISGLHDDVNTNAAHAGAARASPTPGTRRA